MFGKKRKFRREILKLVTEMGVSEKRIPAYHRTLGIDQDWKEGNPVREVAIQITLICLRDIVEDDYYGDIETIKNIRDKVSARASSWGRDGLIGRDTAEFVITFLKELKE
jgi:hypothetical protein